MGDQDINNSDISDYKNSGYMTDYSVDAGHTDSPIDQKETTYTFTKWTTWLGYYQNIPELQAAINAKADWTVGKGYTSPVPQTEILLDSMTGNGTDTFNTILSNMVRNYHIGGDAFAEIIRDDEDVLINLKPLSPENMMIVANRQGLIIRYEQINKVKGQPNKKFQPEEILHLSRNRIADEIHGVSMVKAVEEIILMRNEAMKDYKKLLHRNIYPPRLWKLDTDDPTKISAFKAKVAQSKGQGEDIFIPMGTVETELAGVTPNSTLNPLPWIHSLTQYFYQAAEVPQIIVGGAQEITEASAKIAFLAFEQPIAKEQLYIENQILAQLQLEIELTFPVTIQNEVLSDRAKEETTQAVTPEDTSVGTAGQEVGNVGFN